MHPPSPPFRGCLWPLEALQTTPRRSAYPAEEKEYTQTPWRTPGKKKEPSRLILADSRREAHRLGSSIMDTCAFACKVHRDFYRAENTFFLATDYLL
jgi:hypothetical protein